MTKRGAQVFAWGHGLRLWGARRDPEVRISVLVHRLRGEGQRKQSLQPKLRRDLLMWMSVPAHRFMDEDKKRGLRCKIEGFASTFTCTFVLERKFAYARGGTSSIFGGHRPQNAL